MKMHEVFFRHTPIGEQTKMMLARRIMIAEGLTLPTCFSLLTRLDKRTLAARLGIALPVVVRVAAGAGAPADGVGVVGRGRGRGGRDGGRRGGRRGR